MDANSVEYYMMFKRNDRVTFTRGDTVFYGKIWDDKPGSSLPIVIYELIVFEDNIYEKDIVNARGEPIENLSLVSDEDWIQIQLSVA